MQDFDYRPRSAKMVNSALCNLYVELRRDGGDGLEHVETLLRLRGVDPKIIRVPEKRKRIFRRGELWRAGLEAGLSGLGGMCGAGAVGSGRYAWRGSPKRGISLFVRRAPLDNQKKTQDVRTLVEEVRVKAAGTRGRAMHLVYRPKIEKIIELLLHMAHVRSGADKYQAVKFLYLADREHINRYGRPITQESYWALPYGSVASTAKDLVEGDRKAMFAAGIGELPFDVTPRGKYEYLENPKRAVDLDLFSKSDLKVFDEIIGKYGERSFDDLFRITHDHAAYQKAWSRRKPGAKAVPMFYDEMIESDQKRIAMLEDFGDLAQYLE